MFSRMNECPILCDLEENIMLVKFGTKEFFEEIFIENTLL